MRTDDATHNDAQDDTEFMDRALREGLADLENRREPGLAGRRKHDQWTVRRILEIGTAVGMLWGGYVTISAYFAAQWATRDEVKVITSAVDTLRVTTDRRFLVLEARQTTAERTYALIPAMARLQCLDLGDRKRTTLAQAAAMPCDSLLRRVQ